MLVEVDVKSMHTKFGGHGLSSFGDFATFQIWPNSLFEPWTIVHGSKKISPKIMQVDVDAKRMRAKFGGRGL